MSLASTGSVDLEAVLNVGRRALVSISESSTSFQQARYANTIYLKREDSSNSIYSIDSKIVIFGELQLLCSIFERYTSQMTFFEEVTNEVNSQSPSSSNKHSFSGTTEEDELEVNEEPPIISTLRQTSLSPTKVSSSPPSCSPGATRRRKAFHSANRKQTVSSSMSEYSAQSLDGKRYGCIELPNMKMIEILEILLRSGLDLVDVSSDYDKNTLHQSFVFSKVRLISQKHGQ